MAKTLKEVLQAAKDGLLSREDQERLKAEISAGKYDTIAASEGLTSVLDKIKSSVRAQDVSLATGETGKLGAGDTTTDIRKEYTPEKSMTEKVAEEIPGGQAVYDAATSPIGQAVLSPVKAAVDIVKAPYEMTKDTIDIAKEGISTLSEAAKSDQEIASNLTSESTPQEYSDAMVQTVSNLQDVISGGVAVTTAPLLAVFQNTPVISDMANFFIEKMQPGNQLIAEKLATTPEGEEAIIKSLNNLTWMITGELFTNPTTKALGNKIIESGVAEKALSKAGEVATKTGEIATGIFEKDPMKIAETRKTELSQLESGNTPIRKFVENATKKGVDVKDIVSKTDLDINVDKNGTIRTTLDGGAVDQMTEYLKPQEDIISKILKAEDNTIKLSEVESYLSDAVKNSKVKGGAKLRALNTVADDIAGYKLDAVDSTGKPWVEGISTGDPYLNLYDVQDFKVDKYANVNYLNPESKIIDKLIAKSLKEIIEKNTKSADVKALNQELAKYYTVMEYLEKLDGKKVKGGRLGKYFAQTVGAVVGSHFGPLGTVIGAELGGAIKGMSMASKFGETTGVKLEPSEAMKSAMGNVKDYENSLGNLNTAQSATKMNTTNPILESVAQILKEVNPPKKSLNKTAEGSTTGLKSATMEKTKTNMDLIQEAKKYKSAEEFFNRMNPALRDGLREQGIKGREQITKLWEDTTGLKSKKSYQMAHRPTETGDFASDITKSGESMPKDFYQHPEYYAQIKQQGDYGIATRESLSVLMEVKGNPEANVTIYRASPSNKLNSGDWVTLSKKYAELSREGKETVHSFDVKAKDVQFAGDDINEFGYFPK